MRTQTKFIIGLCALTALLAVLRIAGAIDSTLAVFAPVIIVAAFCALFLIGSIVYWTYASRKYLFNKKREYGKEKPKKQG